MATTVVEQAYKLLRSSGWSDLTQIVCSLQNGSLLLEGTLPTYYLKQMAQETVRGLGHPVLNKLKVKTS